MTQPFLRVTRGGITESLHDGVVAIVSDKGDVLAHYGDISLVTFARSSAKPIQAIPLVESGAIEHYDFEEADLALFCASHSSELMHTDRVARILEKIGLDESYLQCGGHVPHHMETYDRVIRAGGEMTPLYSNCSGKHSGMLAYCRQVGAPVETYNQKDHPLQQKILAVLADLADVDESDVVIGIDGCTVPAFAMSVEAWGRVFGKYSNPSVAKSHTEAMTRISKAMRAHPEMVGGTDRFDTDLMRATDGRIMCKGGAEGFMAVSVLDKKFGLVMKVLDGNARGIPAVILSALEQMDALSGEEKQRLQKYLAPQITNTRQTVVGEVVAEFDLVKS